MRRVDPASFEAAYADGADPWAFATSAYEQRRYDAIESLLRPAPAEGFAYRRCFEPACSVGVLTARLANRCAEVVAVDPSPSAVATAAQRLAGLAPERVRLETRSIPEWWPEGRFDLVVFSELGYYWDVTGLRDLVERLAASRQPGGDLVAAHWLGDSPDHVLHGSTVHAVLGEVLGEPTRQLDGDGFLAARVAIPERRGHVTAERSALADFGHDLPLPGAGRTAERMRRLWRAAALDPTFGRLAEAHADALAILAEADRPVCAGDHRAFGVWAARGAEPVRLQRLADGWLLAGRLPWCSGAGLVDAALIAAEHDGSTALVVVPTNAPGVRAAEADWQSPAFPEMDTRTVDLDVRLPPDAIVGLDNWYLDRPGFWHGAVSVAACWAGAVDGLVARVRPSWHGDPHALAHLGAIDAALWQLDALLGAAGDEIDAAPFDVAAAHRRALRVRHVVDVTAAEITDRLQRALGPSPFVRTPELHRIVAECDLFRRQCHAERDLEVLGRLVAEDG